MSLFNRFPGIINSEQIQFLSTDISILNRQLDTILKREKDAQIHLEENQKKIENLTQQKIELSQEERLLADLFHQRDQEKTTLARSLKQELDSAKVLYVSESRSIEQKFLSAQIQIKELLPQLENLKSLHNSLTKKRPLTITVLPQQLQTISSNLSTQHILFINKLDNFLNWWTSRRLNQHYIDRLAFLDEVTNKTQERVDTSYKSIEFLQRSVILKKEEITSIKKMNDVLA